MSAPHIKAKASKQPTALEAKPVMELLEEGVNLLKRLPASGWFFFALGYLPFVAGLILFQQEMVHSAVASHILPLGSAMLVCLYIWLKVWQCPFAKAIRDALYGDVSGLADRPVSPLTTRMLRQTAWQSLQFWIQPISILITLSLGATTFFFQNLTILETDERPGESIYRRAIRLALPASKQALFVLLALGGIGFIVFLNWFTILLFIPFLVRTLFGVENLLLQSPGLLFNSSSFVVCLGLSYLTLDPLLKAIAVLRIHYIESETSGIDLELALQKHKNKKQPAAAQQKIKPHRARSLARVSAVLMLLFAGAASPTPLAAAESTAPPPAASAKPDVVTIDKTVEETLEARRFLWRLPPDLAQAEEKGWIANLLEGLSRSFEAWQERLRRWMERNQENDYTPPQTGSALSGAENIGYLLIILLILTVLGMIVYFLVNWQRTVAGAETSDSESSQPKDSPDLEDEAVLATSQSVQRWLDIARDQLAKGEHRLAMRACFLAHLAWLADSQFIRITRTKSNRDYLREVSKRGNTEAILIEFRKCIGAFEQAWYGAHQAESQEVQSLIDTIAGFPPPQASPPATPSAAMPPAFAP